MQEQTQDPVIPVTSPPFSQIIPPDPLTHGLATSQFYPL